MRGLEIGCYARRYSSGNYGAHCMRVDLGPITIWFSYQTPVAFHVEGHARVVQQNYWGPTTGKHLNEIDGGDKSGRVDSATFERLFSEQCQPVLDLFASPTARDDWQAFRAMRHLERTARGEVAA